ncbi:MAG TPA: type II secretion system protein N [Spongiibacteraceae bacterium]|nr:type II secretion system protein N [Spongiibacteraceae bacterium]
MSWRWTAPGIALVLVFAVIQAPAWLLSQQAQRQLPGLDWLSAEGTVWSGSGMGLYYRFGDRQLFFERLQWRVQPLALLRGRLSLAVRAEGQGQYLAGDLGSGLDGVWRFENGTLALPVTAIAGAGSQLHGQLELAIAELAIDDQQILALEGTGLWRAARWQAPGYTVSLGDLALDLEDDGKGAAAIALRNRGGDDSLSANLNLDLLGRYRLRAALAPAPDSRAGWTQWLPLLATPDGEGGYQLTDWGTLW